ncbi:MAG: FtsX-like permease family protein, partial [Acidobacteriota bacterium]
SLPRLARAMSIGASRARLPLPFLLAWRYLRGERSQVLSSTALAALIAIGLGVTAMVVAMALMTGYTDGLKKRLIGLQGDIIASPLGRGAFEREADALVAAAALPGVEKTGRVAYGEGAITSPTHGETVSVVIRGIDPAAVPPLVDAEGTPRVGTVDLSGGGAGLAAGVEDGVPSVLLGVELARRLEAAEGDVLRLVILSLDEDRPRFRYRSVRYVGTFTTGFAEFDARWALVARELVETARGTRGLDVFELSLAPDADSAAVAARLEEVLGPSWLIQRWETLNSELFAALALQESLLFLVLGLIVVVSTFNVASTLVILVRERLSDIGVLGSLGLPARQLWWAFVGYGLGLGALGTMAGLACGSAISWLLTETELIRFDPEVAAIYFIDSVPFRVEARDLMAIATFSLVVTFFACALPALRAARLQPADALRDP